MSNARHRFSRRVYRRADRPIKAGTTGDNVREAIMQWRSIMLAASASVFLVLGGCGGGGSSGSSGGSNTAVGTSTDANALCPSSLDYSTVYTGGSGAGELVTVQLDTTAQ